jgi:hypothetical protein
LWGPLCNDAPVIAPTLVARLHVDLQRVASAICLG